MRRIELSKTRYVIMAATLALSLIQGIPAPAVATSEAFTGSASVSGIYGVATPITDLQVSGVGNDTISVRLFVSYGTLAMSTTTGLTFTGSSSGASLQFSGTRSDINTALATLAYTRSTPGTDTLEASLVGAGEIYYPANGHLYEVVTSTQTWTAAQSAAASRTKYGATGYLATITSAEENAFIAARLSGAGWMGASDAATEGDWKWVTGPEAGTSFWSGNGSGTTVSGRYANWNPGEPNDSGGNEDCAQYIAGGSGLWNDLPCTVTTLPAYVVEYGAPGTLPAVQSKNVTINTGVSSHTISSCAQLQAMADTANTAYDTFMLTKDIDCSAVTNFAPIGSGGSAAWNVFRGTFDGGGHQITGLTVNNSSGHAGLFTKSIKAAFHDLTLGSGTVTSTSSNVGALVGEADETAISNVTSQVSVSGTDHTGGLVGYYTMTGQDLTLTNLHVSADITSSAGSAQTAGLIGGVSLDAGAELTIVRAGFSGNATGVSGVGGLVGEVYLTENGTTGFTLLDSYADSTVTGDQFVGGLIGIADPNINNSNAAGTCYITLTRDYAAGGTVTNLNYGSGLVGYEAGVAAGESFTVTDSFSASVPGGPASNRSSLFYVAGSPSGGTVSTSGIVVDDTRTGYATWANISPGGISNVNTPGSPDANYFFKTTSQHPLDAWDFASGNVWFQHPDTFPTHAPGTDDDEDGAPGASEDAGPNHGDANNDGILDSRQSNVVSFINGLTNKFVAAEVPSGCQFTNVAMRTESQLGTDGGYDYPGGLVRFVANCGTPGATANVKLYFYNTAKDNLILRKVNPVRHAYYAMPNAVLTQLTIGGTTVTRASYEVTDGSTLDEDGVANGIIIDPAGLALAAVGVPNTGLGGTSRR